MILLEAGRFRPLGGSRAPTSSDTPPPPAKVARGGDTWGATTGRAERAWERSAPSSHRSPRLGGTADRARLGARIRLLFDDDTEVAIRVEANIPRESTVQIRRDEDQALRAAGRIAARRGDDLEAVVHDTGAIGAILRRRPEAEGSLRHAYAKAIATMAPRHEHRPALPSPDAERLRQSGELAPGGPEDDPGHD